jgi:mRNA interferase HigB
LINNALYRIAYSVLDLSTLKRNKPRDLNKNVTILVTFFVYLLMRVIAVKTLKEFWESAPEAEQALLAWYEEAEAAQWANPNELKQQYRNASIITDKRVIFNIHGNSYRLIVDIEYRLKIVFIVWFGTHKQYNKIDAKKVSYVKANKK